LELNIMAKKVVACSEFVKRQTEDSGFSHFEGTWEQLEALATDRFTAHSVLNYVHPGYKDGVVLVDMPAQWFRSAIVELQPGDKLKASYSPRRQGEAPYIRVSAKGKKQAALYAQVVLYSHDVLMENNETEKDAEWEIVAIKARSSKEEEPMDYYTMARNYLNLVGGTKGNFTAEEFAKSIVYWNSHVMLTSKPKWYRKIKSFFKKDES